MRLSRLIICFACVVVTRFAIAEDAPTATPPKASEESQVIDASDKAAVDAAMNKEVVVEGVVESAAWSQSGKVMLIHFPNGKETKFAAAVFQKKKADFDAAFSGDLCKALTGAKVRIRGKVKEFKGHPEIVLDVPAQITIVEPPSTQPE